MVEHQAIRRRALHPRQFLNDLVGVQAFERGDAIARHRPLEVHIQTTSACNLDCAMCFEHLRSKQARRGRALEVLSPDLFERIACEILPYSSRAFFGAEGEPMLSPHFLAQVERAHGLGQQVYVATNGTLIGTDEQADVLARCVSRLEISVDGATRATYERIRSGASFAQLLRNIERLNRARRALSQEDRARLTLCVVLMKSNVHELPALVELAARLEADGVAAWHVIPVTPEGRRESLVEESELAERHLAEARGRARALGIELDLPAEPSPQVAGSDGAGPAQAGRSGTMRYLRRLDAAQGTPPAGAVGPRLHCHLPTLALFVLHDGRVYPCGNPLAHGNEPMGDLREQGLAQIWNGRRLRNLRAGLVAGDPPPLCRSCALVRDPAPACAEPFEPSASLVAHYGERDLAPLDGLPATFDLIDEAVRTGLAAHLQSVSHQDLELRREREAMRGHIANLERILARIHGMQVYRSLCRVKDLFVRPGPADSR